MTSNNVNATSSLMGYNQMYDDTRLRKRVNCLVSGLLLCFVIGAAALGVAIMVLLKIDDGTGAVTSAISMQSEEVIKLKHQLDRLQKDLTALQSEVKEMPQNALRSDAETIKQAADFDLSIESPADTDKSMSVPDSLPNYSESPSPMNHDTHEGHGSHGSHGMHGSHGTHAGHMDDTSFEIHTDSSNEDHVGHESHTGHENHSAHGDHTGHGGHTVYDPMGGEMTYDDSDWNMVDGSGDVGRIEDILDDEDGSGMTSEEDKTPCFVYSRPTCPIGVQICNTTDPCPVPICCPN